MPGDQERCLAAGANDYVSKPFRMNQLVNLIETYLTRPGDKEKG
jgi:CheY-like chemotaxis protein